MNKRIDLTKLGGFPVTQYTLDWMQDSYRSAFAALAIFIGDKVVLHGVENLAGTVSDGWVSLNGELLPFVGGLVAADCVVVETTEDRLFQDGNTKTVYYKRIVTFGAGAGSFPFADLQRIGTLKDMWLGMAPKDSLMYYEGLIADLPAGWQIHILSKGRVIVGQDDTDPTFETIGLTGGQKAVALAATHNGPHSHIAKRGESYTGGGAPTSPIFGRGANDPRDITIGSSGEGTPHNNLQPYYVAAIIKKVI